MDEVLERDELETAGVLAELGRLRRLQSEVERDQVQLVAHFADVHDADTLLARADRGLPGRERGVRFGGGGTPAVAEFAVAELAAELGLSSFAGKQLIADVLDLRHRLPRVWARVLDCEVPVWVARRVAHDTRSLTAQQARYVDGEVAPFADGRLPTGRLLTLVEAAIVAADPDAARERERAAASDRFAKVGRSNEHGSKTLYVKTSAAEMVRIDATLAYLADALATLGDTDTLDKRRTKAMLVLANPVAALQLVQALHTRTGASPRTGNGAYQADDTPFPDDDPAADRAADESADDASGTEPSLLGVFGRFRPDEVPACTCQGGAWSWDPATVRTLMPSVTLYLHLQSDPNANSDTAGTGGGRVVRWEGEGPVTAGYLREVLGPHAIFTVKPVIDLANQSPVDAYETPSRLKEAVQLRSPADMFPWGTSTSRHMDAEHSVPYRPPERGGPPGQTGMANLGLTNRYHHRVKTHAPGWTLKQPYPGIYLWQAPHGALYLVDHTGTRQVRGTPTPEAQAEQPESGPSSRIECFFNDVIAAA